MKKLLLLLLAFISWDNSIFAQCESNAIVYTISPGYFKTGPSLGMEAGLWPNANKVGVMGGFVMYGRETVNKGVKETVVDLDVTGRLVYKITPTGSDNPQMFTLYGSLRGMIGASYRVYWSLGEYSLFGIEPCYSNKTGPGVNILFTTRLN